MNATSTLHDLGQSMWLDIITRGLLTSGTLGRYINDLAVTGLTSNPTIVDDAIKDGDFYDDGVPRTPKGGASREMRVWPFGIGLHGQVSNCAELPG